MRQLFYGEALQAGFGVLAGGLAVAIIYLAATLLSGV
jgi:hypothetical protein